jgi:hypothetical protein
MKNILLIILTIILTLKPVLSFSQEMNNSEKQKEISYAFINEYGFSFNAPYPFFMAINSVFVNGIRFNKTQNEIGIGIGYDFYFIIQTFSIFANYRHYFPSKKSIKPHINIGLGTQLSFWRGHDFYEDSPHDYERNNKLQCYGGLYATVATGFKIKAFSFSVGGFAKSIDKNSYFGGAEIKMGFTF